MRNCDIHETARATGGVLVCGGDDGSHQFVTQHLSGLGWTVNVAVGIDRALQVVESSAFDVCLVVCGGESDAVERLQERIVALDLDTQLLCLQPGVQHTLSLLNPVGGIHSASDAAGGILQLGGAGELGVAMRAAAERSRVIAENRRLKRQFHSRLSQDLIGHSEAMQAVRERVRETADADDPVLLQGETGTELTCLARAIHQSSRRSHRYFLSLDCSVLSSDSLTQALFGGDPSSSQPAESPDTDGFIEQAAGGTLLLENVERAALPLQKKLCRLCQPDETDAPKASRLPAANVRLIATTHADLSALCDARRFRPDLLRLLGRILIAVPPLRDRTDDISPLTECFLKRFALAEGRPPKRLTLDGLVLLKQYDWPGNVRELQNVVERVCTLDGGERLTAEIMRPWLAVQPNSLRIGSPNMSLKEMERKLIETTFARCGGNRERTAQSLGIGLRTLSGKLREYGYPPRGGPGSNLAVVHRKAA